MTGRRRKGAKKRQRGTCGCLVFVFLFGTMSTASATASPPFCYDAHSKCFKYDSRLIGEDGAVRIRGAIVDVKIEGEADDNGDITDNLVSYLQGKIFPGEIIDIIKEVPSEERKDFGKHSQPALQSATSQGPNAISDEARGWSTEQILQSHRQMQSLHATQYQRLLHKHMNDWRWFHAQNLSVERLLEMQHIHQRESMELQSRQQREQSNLLDFILFNWVPMNFKASTHSQHATALTNAPLLAATEPLKSASMAAPHAGRENVLPPPLPDPPTSLPEKISIDRQKADEIKAVMRDRLLSQSERQRKLADIRQKYIAGNVVGTPILHSHHSSTNDATNEQNRQIELQAIMRDPSLSREAKLERIALINAKYTLEQPSQHPSQKKMSQNVVKGEMQSRSMKVKSKANDVHDGFDDKDAVAGMDGEEDENDQSLNSGSQSLETNRSSGSPQSSHFSTSSSTSSSSPSSSSSVKSMGPKSDAGEDHATSVGGGGIQVKATVENSDTTTTANVLGHSQTDTYTVDAEALKSPSHKESTSRSETAITRLSTSHLIGIGLGNDSSRSGKPSDSGNAVDNGTVKVAMSDTAAKKVNDVSDDPFQGIPTDRTPIKKLIEKLNDDDASLTVLKLDGRTQIKANDWKSLFQSLESNSTVTHLSISRCKINDEVATDLVLAMVVNETIVALRLNHNEGLTDETGKGFIKVLRQSNSTIKQLEVNRTKITKKLTQELNTLLEVRDHAKVDNRHQKQTKSKQTTKVEDAATNGKDKETKHRRRSILALAKSVTSLKKEK